MTKILKNEKEMWNSIKNGTFVDEYLKDARTALQKAIDKHTETLSVQRKVDEEDGDLQMFDGKGWVQFCIHKAKKLINDDKLFVGVRQRISGIWVNHSPHVTETFNSSLRERSVGASNKNDEPGISFEKSTNHHIYGRESERGWYQKMFKQDQEDTANRI